MESTIIFMIFAGAFLLFMVFNARNYRHKNYTRSCPNCGYPTCRPHTTGYKVNGEPQYNYKCPKCGHKFSRFEHL